MQASLLKDMAARIFDYLSDGGYGRDFTVFSGDDYCSVVAGHLMELMEAHGYSCRVADARNYTPHGEVIIDALAGRTLVSPAEGELAEAIRTVNSSGCRVISLDIPSGMPAVPVRRNVGEDIVKACVTLSFGTPAMSLMLPDYGNCGGRIEVLGGSDVCIAEYRYIDAGFHADMVASSPVLCSVDKFAHKGSNGHLFMMCGKPGMAGAAILATSGALRSGCGLVTVRLPESERLAMHVSHPSAIVSIAENDSCPDFGKYSAICAGCGWGTDETNVQILQSAISSGLPLLLDADALNLIASHDCLRIPEGAVITPHLGEFRRLAGEWKSDSHRVRMARDFASVYGCVLVLKGAHTMVAAPDGRYYFNSTGTPGMAKGGCGDVLAGYISGLLARGCDPLEAAVVGVYRHGLAGEDAALRYGDEAMNASDLFR